MATLSLKNFTTLVQDMAAACQASASSIIDFTAGSVARAIMEGNASVALWLQWLILKVLAMTRLATSTGADADTWVADFGLTRTAAIPSSGKVTFSRTSTTNAAFIPVGAQVKTADASRVFSVVADATNAAWNGSNGFTLAAGVSSLQCTVQDITTDALGALSIGSAGNVAAGTITLLASTITGVDAVTNALAFTNGVDAETDAALRAQFSNYIQTRSRATPTAIEYAISSIGGAVSYTIQENVDTLANYTPGHFVVTVDDGSGAPPSTFIDQVSAAIALYRPIGSTWDVRAPSIVTVTVAMTLTCNPTTAKTSALLLAVTNAIISYIDALPDGATLPYTRLAMIAYSTDPSIVDVTAVLLNGGTADVVPTAGQVVKAASGGVTVS